MVEKSTLVNGFWLWNDVMLDRLTMVSINIVLCNVREIKTYCRSSPAADKEINSGLLLQKLGSVLGLCEFTEKGNSAVERE